MKTSIYIAILLFAFLEKTDAQIEKIKTRLEFKLVNVGKEKLVGILNYNSKGQTIKIINILEDGRKDTTVQIFDGEQLIQINYPRDKKTGLINVLNRSFDDYNYLYNVYYTDKSDSLKSYKTTYYNDKFGKPLEELVTYKRTRTRRNYTYDTLNQLKKDVLSQSVFDLDYNDWEPFEFKKENNYEYNEKGQLTLTYTNSWLMEEVMGKPKMKNKLFNQTIYTYNEKGQLTETETKEFEPFLNYKKTIYNYNEFGKESKKKIFQYNSKNPSLQKEETFIYKYELY